MQSTIVAQKETCQRDFKLQPKQDFGVVRAQPPTWQCPWAGLFALGNLLCPSATSEHIVYQEQQNSMSIITPLSIIKYPWEFCSWESSWSTSSSLNTNLCRWSTDLSGPVGSSGAQSQAVTNVIPLQFLLPFTRFIPQCENALLRGTGRRCFIIPHKLA